MAEADQNKPVCPVTPVEEEEGLVVSSYNKNGVDCRHVVRWVYVNLLLVWLIALNVSGSSRKVSKNMSQDERMFQTLWGAPSLQWSSQQSDQNCRDLHGRGILSNKCMPLTINNY